MRAGNHSRAITPEHVRRLRGGVPRTPPRACFAARAVVLRGGAASRAQRGKAPTWQKMARSRFIAHPAAPTSRGGAPTARSPARRKATASRFPLPGRGLARGGFAGPRLRPLHSQTTARAANRAAGATLRSASLRARPPPPGLGGDSPSFTPEHVRRLRGGVPRTPPRACFAARAVVLRGGAASRAQRGKAPTGQKMARSVPLAHTAVPTSRGGARTAHTAAPTSRGGARTARSPARRKATASRFPLQGRGLARGGFAGPRLRPLHSQTTALAANHARGRRLSPPAPPPRGRGATIAQKKEAAPCGAASLRSLAACLIRSVWRRS